MYKIELDRIVQKAVVNETALANHITIPAKQQSQELFGVASPPEDKAPSAARLHPSMVVKQTVSQQWPTVGIHPCLFHKCNYSYSYYKYFIVIFQVNNFA